MDEVIATAAHAASPLAGVNIALTGVAALVLATSRVCDGGRAPVAAIVNESKPGETVNSGPLLIANETLIDWRTGTLPGASIYTVALCLPKVRLETT